MLQKTAEKVVDSYIKKLILNWKQSNCEGSQFREKAGSANFCTFRLAVNGQYWRIPNSGRKKIKHNFYILTQLVFYIL